MPMRTAFKPQRKDNIMLTKMPTPEEAIAIMGEVLPAEDADWPAYVIGTPERVKAVVERITRDTGATEIMVQDVLHDAALRHRNYELLARTFGLTTP